jgi:hypothetical protein
LGVSDSTTVHIRYQEGDLDGGEAAGFDATDYDFEGQTGGSIGMKRRKRRPRRLDEGHYVCPSCGEQVVVPLDASQGREQQYVEDCPVCCNPNIIHVELDPTWEEPRVWAEAE